MVNFPKLIFYYEPGCKNPYTRAYTLSFSRIDTESNTYKQKAILQHWSEQKSSLIEYKIKEIKTDAKKLIEKINKIDFNKSYISEKTSDEILYIYFGNKKLIINNINDIYDILSEFHFFDLYSISHYHYQYIKNTDDYIKLKNILLKEINKLPKQERLFIQNYFKEHSPYDTFKHISELNTFIKEVQHSA